MHAPPSLLSQPGSTQYVLCARAEEALLKASLSRAVQSIVLNETTSVEICSETWCSVWITLGI